MKKNTFDDDQNFNLLEAINVLWKGRIVIIATTFISLVVSSLYLHFEKNKFVSLMYYSVNDFQGFILTEKSRFKDQRNQFLTNQAFQDAFYKEKNFDSWSLNNVSSKLNFNDIKLNYNLNGVEYLKKQEKLEAEFREKKKKWIVLRTNDGEKIDAYFSYANFINDIVTNDYINDTKQIKEMYINLKAKLANDGVVVNNTILKDQIELDNYIRQLATNKVVKLSRPTEPKKVSPNIKLIISIGFLIGLFTGIIYLILKSGFRKIKQNTSN